MTTLGGGYDDGYSRCSCFWGIEPSSLVKMFLARERSIAGLKVLDLGCGEGKNAYAFATAGADVVAVDCSKHAIINGQREFAKSAITWIVEEAHIYLETCDSFDVIVMYGLLHCLPSHGDISSAIDLALTKTRAQGHHIVAAFNDGPHDLSAHPGFHPTLVSHQFYLDRYAGHQIEFESDSMIHEAHPHNGIEHFHSLTRLMARKM